MTSIVVGLVINVIIALLKVKMQIVSQPYGDTICHQP